MSRLNKIRLYGLEIVQADERYWAQLGYKIDYNKDLLVRIATD